MRIESLIVDIDLDSIKTRSLGILSAVNFAELIFRGTVRRRGWLTLIERL